MSAGRPAVRELDADRVNQRAGNRGRLITKGRNDENTKRKTPLEITIRFATSLAELECIKRELPK
jgi:hypothetical protein